MCCTSQNPLISVIVPVYNVQAYLRECLDSLKDQTYTNLEILIVDDGSTDCSGKICDEYAAQDSRFKVFHTENRGLSGARNYGLNQVSGEFVGFVDSDDKCELTMYESLVNAAIKHRADITFGARSTWFAYCVKQDKHPVKHDIVISRNDFMRAIFGQGEWRSTSVAGGYVWLKLFKRQTIEGLKFVDTKVCLEDELFCASACLKAETICCIEDHLLFYRQRQNSLIRDRSFAFSLLKGRIEIDRLVKDEELISSCQQALIHSLVSASRYWGPNMSEPDKELLLTTAKRLLPLTKKYGNFKWSFYIRMLTMPEWLRDCFFLLRRSFSTISRKPKKSQELF